MKSAAGEANLTVITIILICIMVPVITVIVKNLMTTSAKKSCCNGAGGVFEKGTCSAPAGAKNRHGYSMEEYQNCIEKVLG